MCKAELSIPFQPVFLASYLRFCIIILQSSLEAYQSLEIIGRPGSGKSLVEIISHIDLDRLQYSFARDRSQIGGGTRGERIL